MKHLVTALAATALVAGCASAPAFNREPAVSNLDLTRQTMPEVASVQVPLPVPQPVPVPTRAESASLWAPGARGFFGDQRATAVGDILTIDIEIDDEASLANASSRERDGEGSVAMPTALGYENHLANVIPGISQDELSDPLIGLRSETNASGSGTIRRNESIKLKVAAMVIQLLPNGNMVVAGRQEVKVNDELRELRVAGIIRPQDIQMNNTVPYDKIAEARISYGGEGSLSRTQTRGYGEDVMDIVLPY
ncbi:flagellar L-ring protein precursor [Oceanicola granulosus HTCC2516]|uniref:Flagellar L-ring protein n=1 Tax=Oceanicola granulosus (strain ATCC BAA-861 / DSM 15982 / KCTC 12143 / HTCC2516) TaxID=314256 RepID=Q2CGG0_OCEGH|nr:flagellar basal body L-ring protein FlgH [Oceanicola granulosus]EAR51758.1 flagellar L-ring protein precursor [Oceanicola granulosus HTCC2516]